MCKRGENIYRRADGRWEGRYIVGYHPLSGRAKFGYVYADSYRKAKKLKQEKMRERGIRSNGRKRQRDQGQEPTVGMCLEEWLEHKEAAGELRTSTLQLYRRQIRSHILPDLGNCRISRLTEGVLEEFKSRKRKSGRLDGTGGLSSAAVEGLMGILYAMLQYEWELGQIGEPLRRKGNVSRDAGKGERESLAFSEEEQKQMERVLYREIEKKEENRGIYLGILFAFYTGLRVGELGGLQWKDVDLKKSTVSVRRTLQRIAAPGTGGSESEPQHGAQTRQSTAQPGEQTHQSTARPRAQTRQSTTRPGMQARRSTAMPGVQTHDSAPHPGPRKRKTVLQLGPPKSESSCRSFPVKEELTAVLRRYQAALPKERTGPDQPVFANDAGRPVEPRLFQKYFAGLLRKAGVEKRKFHALRHTFATRCVENNMDIQSLSECLGHSSSNITLRVYAHSFMEHKRSCMKRLAFHWDIQTIENAPFGKSVS